MTVAKETQQVKSETASTTYTFVVIAVEQFDQGPSNESLRDRQNPSPTLSSSADSAIGGSSPSSCCNTSTNGSVEWHPQQSSLRMNYFIVPDKDLAEDRTDFTPTSCQIELNCDIINEHLQKINNDAMAIGSPILLVSTPQDIRQFLYPFIASQIISKGQTEDCEPRSLSQVPLLFQKFLPVKPSNTTPEKTTPSLDERLMSTFNSLKEEICRKTQEGNENIASNVQLISQKYFTSGINVEPSSIVSSTIVRMRGLPWQATDTDIALFFHGLNIMPGGIALCLSSEGKRNGEALVRFENAEQREMALQRHRKFLYNRYIEIYRAGSDDFIQMAIGVDPEARRFTSQKAAMIVRMRGLPFNCTEQQIKDFFSAEGGEKNGGIVDQGILFVTRHDGRPSGDAFVLFAEEALGKKAIVAKNKQRIGTRYIELFRTTQAEVHQLFNRARLNPPLQALSTNTPQASPGKTKDCIRLRGLPYEAQVDQVVAFLGEYAKNIVFQGVHMIYTNQGQPSGEAFIQMDSEASAAEVTSKMHNKYMELGKKKRYIEIFQSSAEDMNVLLGAVHPIATPLAPTALAPFPNGIMSLGLPPPPAGFFPAGIHPLNLLQAPPTTIGTQLIPHQPTLLPSLPALSLNHELSFANASILSTGGIFPPMFCSPADLNIPLQVFTCHFKTPWFPRITGFYVHFLADDASDKRYSTAPFSYQPFSTTTCMNGNNQLME